MRVYNVTLSNAHGIFDEHNRIDGVGAVMEFVRGRGGKYTVQIDAGQAENGKFVCLGYDDDAGVFTHNNGWDDQTIKPDDLPAYINQYI